MTLETLVHPAGEPVTLAEAQAFARVGADGDDRLIASLIVAARQAFEARTGRALVTRRVRQRFRGPRAAGVLRLALRPVAALVEARVLDGRGGEAIAPPGLVTLDGDGVVLAQAVPGLLLTYDAGHGGPQLVPQTFKLAVLEAVAAALARRDSGGGDAGGGFEARLHEVRL